MGDRHASEKFLHSLMRKRGAAAGGSRHSIAETRITLTRALGFRLVICAPDPHRDGDRAARARGRRCSVRL